MDVLKPELVWIENRCYRKIPVRDSLVDKSSVLESAFSPKPREYEDEGDYDNYEDLMIKSQNGIFWISLHVPKELIGPIIGQGHKKIKFIEETTGATIKIPPKHGGSEIAVSGQSKESVGNAYRRIEASANLARWRLDFTHFISFPMNNAKIQESYLKFKHDVLSTCRKVRGIDENLFQEPKKLHLTVTPLTLLDEEDQEKAEAVFQKCKMEILKLLDGKPLTVQVKGIEYMNDDPAEVDVLYAKVTEADDNCMQIICDRLMNAFVDANFSKKQYDRVKLHITLMNKTFRSNKEESFNASFDAKPILEKYLEYDFGEITIDEIHISIRYSTDEKGYYRANNKISLL